MEIGRVDPEYFFNGRADIAISFRAILPELVFKYHSGDIGGQALELLYSLFQLELGPLDMGYIGMCTDDLPGSSVGGALDEYAAVEDPLRFFAAVIQSVFDGVVVDLAGFVTSSSFFQQPAILGKDPVPPFCRCRLSVSSV